MWLPVFENGGCDSEKYCKDGTVLETGYRKNRCFPNDTRADGRADNGNCESVTSGRTGQTVPSISFIAFLNWNANKIAVKVTAITSATGSAI